MWSVDIVDPFTCRRLPLKNINISYCRRENQGLPVQVQITIISQKHNRMKNYNRHNSTKVAQTSKHLGRMADRNSKMNTITNAPGFKKNGICGLPILML